MSNAARRGGELTRQLLDYARARPREQVVFDAGDVIREALTLVERTVGAGIQVRERLSATQTLVRGDPGALTDSLLNLAVNSKAAMPAGGELRVETRNVAADEARRLALGEFALAPGTLLEVAVSDQGSGIAPGDLPRIFEPFFSTKPVGGGSGLGLASVYSAMQGMQGAIGVDSAEGSGTSIRLFLPVSIPPGAPPRS
jgi:signal transduction histidine kinase